MTGNEPVMPFFIPNEDGYGDAITLYDANGAKAFINMQYGETLRQRALREFMCAIIQSNEYSIPLEDSDMIEDLNGIYIKVDNKYRYASDYTHSRITRYSVITTAHQRMAKEADRFVAAYINQLNK